MATVFYKWATDVSSFILNGQTPGNQSDVAIAATADGGYLGAWSVGSDFVRGRYVDADGTPAMEHDLNTTLTGNQFDASMALLGNGHNVVTFTDSSSGTDTVRVRILGDGAPFLDFAVPADERPLRESDVAALGSGGFAVAYTRDYGSGDTDLLVQRYAANGDEIGGPISVDGQFGVATDHASIAGLAAGGFVVAWEQSAAAGGDHSVWFQLYNASGMPITTAGDVPGSHHLIDKAGSINQDIQVAALQDGGFVVAYVDNGWLGADNTEITARVYNADGTARSSYIHVNTDIAGAQLRPTVTVLSNGFFVVGWQDDGIFYYQAYDPSGAAAGANYAASNGVYEGEILGLAGGLVASVEESIYTDGDGRSVDSSISALVRTTTGTAAGETLVGDSLRDVMNGYAGNDVLRGGAGADTLDGGAGTDIVMYSESGTGITVNLGAGKGYGGNAEGDTLVSIEGVYGSNVADSLIGGAGADTLVGNAGNDGLYGGAGNDVLSGGAGKDTLTGGVGADRFHLAAIGDSVVGVAADRIADFSQAQGDRIDLSAIDANTMADGNQAFTFIGTGLYTGAAGQLRYVASGGVTTIAGDINGDKVSDFHITLTGNIVLVAADFVL